PAPRPPNPPRTPPSSTSARSAVRGPTRTSSTKRLSGSSATWSQQSPHMSSAGSSGSQFFSFLPTKDHFLSTCTFAVAGGRGDQLVVELSGVGAGPEGVPD